MKRSERYYRDSRSAAFQSATAFSFAIASGAWMAAALTYESPWFIGLLVATVTTITWAILSARESMRLYRIGLEEQIHEARRAIRPRI